MQILKPEAEPQRFFARVRGARQRVLMLDYDGTLAPFRPQRDEAIPYPGVRERLSALSAAGSTRLVLVSGRIAREVARLAALSPPVEVWGTHGWERLHPDGRYEVAPLPADAAAGLDEAMEAARPIDAARVESKPAGVALHLRGLTVAQAEHARQGPVRGWEAIAAKRGLELHEFDGGVELRVPGRSKGTAVAQILAESGRDPACAYLGDDLTDEDAFAAIAPHGLGVLVRTELRATAAAWWLRPPEEMLDFLDQWDAACRRNT